MYGLDVMYCFKFENEEDRTVYTSKKISHLFLELKPKIYEI